MRKWPLTYILIALAILGFGVFFVSRTFKTKKEFFDGLEPEALALERQTGIKSLITLTQAAHESNYGKSQLSLQFHNLFGIKAGQSWTGPIAYLPTKEEIAGKTITVKDSFRAYPTYLDSMRDWASLLARLYPDALKAAYKGDIKAFAKGLTSGKYQYATDSQYGVKLAKVYSEIEAIA